MGEALASKQSWSNSRSQFVMDQYAYPGVMLADSFNKATNTWIAYGASGAGTGSISPSFNSVGNSDDYSLKVTANANSRFMAVRKFDITAGKKLAFNGFFSYDSPVNVAYINIEMWWRDVDHGYTHIAAYRYSTYWNRWEYLPSTATTTVGAWNALGGGTTTMASGAGTWHELYYDADFGNNNYDEMFSGQLGYCTNLGNGLSNLSIPIPAETTEAQRMELRLGLETTASGAGNAYFDDVTVFEVD